MDYMDFVDRDVTLYLEGGTALKGHVRDVNKLRTPVTGGNFADHIMLVMIHNNHTTFVRLDKVVAYEIY